MGTRSVVAVPLDGGFKGRYVHWDGYPEGVGQALHVIVKRDGIDVAVKTLTETYYGWSALNAEGGNPVPQNDGRFKDVEGYGVAYTTVANQSSEDDWINSDGEDWGTEYAYVLNSDHISVFDRRCGTPGEDAGKSVGMFGVGAETGYWLHVGDIAYDSEFSWGAQEILNEQVV